MVNKWDYIKQTLNKRLTSSRFEFFMADNTSIGSFWVEMCTHEAAAPDRTVSKSKRLQSEYLKNNLHTYQ